MIKIDCSKKAIFKVSKKYFTEFEQKIFRDFIENKKYNSARIMTEELREKYPKSKKVELLDALITDMC